MNILIVEDEIFIADMIYRALTKVGYHCECTNDGQSAADLLETNKYDLILLDIMLPLIDGYELMEYIKEFDTPFIFITAKSRLEDRVKGLQIDTVARTVDLHVQRLKKKLDLNDMIVSVRKIGYRMEVSEEGAWLRGRLENGYALFEVEDQGCGIPQEEQTRIFGRFYMVDKVRNGKNKGLGLGLSICNYKNNQSG